MRTTGYWLPAVLLCAALAAPAPAQETLSGEALVEALRRGGYTIFFRHAATDWSRDDHVAAAGDWTSCDPERMRQLTDAGRAAARAVGAAIRRLGIPVSRVLASEYCRTRETARHLELGPVTPTREVLNMRAAEFVGGRDAVVARAREALARSPDPGTNTVVVAHGNLMQAAVGAYTGEAGAVILRPDGDGGLHRVAQLAPEDWEGLAGEFGRPGH